jgi:nucleotide-binding universal stress UspA family protein
MKKTNQNKLLVAVDGSDRSIQTAQYLSAISSFTNHIICFFHVFNKVPESYYDLSKEPSSISPFSSVLAWETQQREHMEKHMDQCRQVLLEADFHPDRIKTVIHNRRVGVARDIIAEARQGYDALMIRRRGLGRLHGLVMGSVAFKLLNSADLPPLLFAARKPFNRRILIAVDGSDNAMRAVTFAGQNLAGGGCSFRIVNVLRGDFMLHQTSPHKMEVRESFENAESEITAFLDAARNQLIASGAAADKISVEIVRDAPSRAAAIVQVAEENHYNTIVLGRKGSSRVREFTIGRVSSKALQIGRELGVWIVQ